MEIEPNTFNDAWNHPELTKKTKWRDAINKEFRDMKSRNVWTVIKRSEIPPERRCVKHKWIFKIKRNGVYRARLVACGCSQVPGIDHDEFFAPVVNEMTFRILIICIILFKLSAKIADVETAFLYGDLEGIELYMDCPQGLNTQPDKCLKLNKTIYGLVQSAHQFFKKLIKCLKDLGFTGGEVDPCLMVKKTNIGLVYVAICLCG